MLLRLGGDRFPAPAQVGQTVRKTVTFPGKMRPWMMKALRLSAILKCWLQLRKDKDWQNISANTDDI